MRSVQIKFYTRKDCHLCEQAWQTLQNLSQELPLEVTAIDVDSDPQLAERFGNYVPVAVAGTMELFRYQADLNHLRQKLRDASQAADDST